MVASSIQQVLNPFFSSYVSKTATHHTLYYSECPVVSITRNTTNKRTVVSSSRGTRQDDLNNNNNQYSFSYPTEGDGKNYNTPH